ncbi:hypothetical protein H8957_001255 [Semnopithecus entellus]
MPSTAPSPAHASCSRELHFPGSRGPGARARGTLGVVVHAGRRPRQEQWVEPGARTTPPGDPATRFPGPGREPSSPSPRPLAAGGRSEASKLHFPEAPAVRPSAAATWGLCSPGAVRGRRPAADSLSRGAPRVAGPAPGLRRPRGGAGRGRGRGWGLSRGCVPEEESSDGESDEEEFQGFHSDEDVAPSSLRSALRSQRGRAPRGRGRKHKTTPLPPPRLADVAPTPPKTPARKRGEEGTERMVQALTELLRRAQAPPAPRSRACEPSTPRRSRGRPPGRPAGPCRRKQQAVVMAEAAVTIPKPEPPPPVVPVKHQTGSWKCKEGPGPGPGTPKRGGQSSRGGRGGRGRGRGGGLPFVIKFVSRAKRVKMGQLSLGLESGQGQGQHEETWQDAPQRRFGSGQGGSPCWKKQEQKLDDEGEEKKEEKEKDEEGEEKEERAVAEEMMPAAEKEETKLPPPPLTPPAPSPPPPLPPPSTSPPPPLCPPPPPPVSPPPLPSPPPPPAQEEQEESPPPVVPATCSRKRGRPPLTPSQRAEREAARAGPEGTSPPTPTPSTATGGPPEDSPTVAPKSTTFLKNIRQFIMPVVSARSSRVIKTPRRFMDEDPPKPPKVEVSPVLRPPITTSPLVPQEPAPVPSPPRAPTPPSTPVPLPEKRRSILREPTFRWTHHLPEAPTPSGPSVYPKRSPPEDLRIGAYSSSSWGS